jgi:hypothetical protein
VLGLVALAANDRPGHDLPPKRMYLTGAQCGKPSAAGRMRSIHVGLIAKKLPRLDDDSSGFFDAFLTACWSRASIDFRPRFARA